MGLQRGSVNVHLTAVVDDLQPAGALSGLCFIQQNKNIIRSSFISCRILNIQTESFGERCKICRITAYGSENDKGWIFNEI